MRKLFEQLENNYYAEKHLNRRYERCENAEYYKIFGTLDMQITQLAWIIQVKKRVLRMRYRLLEKIEAETTKEMQRISTTQRTINTQKVA